MVLQKAIRDGCERFDDLADLVNVALDELVRQSFELPGSTTLADTAQALRASRNDSLYRNVFDALHS